MAINGRVIKYLSFVINTILLLSARNVKTTKEKLDIMDSKWKKKLTLMKKLRRKIGKDFLL